MSITQVGTHYNQADNEASFYSGLEVWEASTSSVCAATDMTCAPPSEPIKLCARLVAAARLLGVRASLLCPLTSLASPLCCRSCSPPPRGRATGFWALISCLNEEAALTSPWEGLECSNLEYAYNEAVVAKLEAHPSSYTKLDMVHFMSSRNTEFVQKHGAPHTSVAPASR